MDLQLIDKKALVTGSTAGIGFAIAALLAQEGASVVVNGRSQQRVEEAVKRIQSQKKDAFWSGGIANPLSVIEQFTYLLFARRLDELHTALEAKANLLK